MRLNERAYHIVDDFKDFSVIDLHTHSNFSDGTWTPGEVVAYAFKLGLSTIALTDHDNVSGISEAISAGSKYGLEVIPGVEITSYHKGVETHILGYFIDRTDSNFLATVKKLSEYRNRAIAKMVALLARKGYTISMNDVISASRSDYIGRPHVARALVDNGNFARVQDAFDGGPIGDDGECFVPMSDLSSEDAIGEIIANGGVAVIAHPGAWPGSGKIFPAEDLNYLAQVGLGGIECAHPRHSEDVRKHFESIADSLGIAKTGGSDCHGEYYNPVKMGSMPMPTDWLLDLKSRNKQGGTR